MDDNFWTNKLQLRSGEGGNTDSAVKSHDSYARMQEGGKLMASNERADARGLLPAIGGSNIKETGPSTVLFNGSNSSLQAHGYADGIDFTTSAHGPSAGYEPGTAYAGQSTILVTGGDNNYSASAERTSVAMNSTVASPVTGTVPHSGVTNNYTTSSEGSAGYTTMYDDPGGPLFSLDDNDGDPGGPVDPPADNVPIDGGVTLILTAGIVSGVRSFRKKRDKPDYRNSGISSKKY